MARKPLTSSQRQAARQRRRDRHVTLPVGLAFLAASGSLAALVLAAGAEVAALATQPAAAASTLAMGGLLAFGSALVGALLVWEARP